MSWSSPSSCASSICWDVYEVAEFGATHSDIGAVLGATWGLTRPVADAVRFHHRPSLGRHRDRPTAMTAVHAARALVDGGMDHERAPFDHDHLDDVAAGGRTRIWGRLAAAGLMRPTSRSGDRRRA